MAKAEPLPLEPSRSASKYTYRGKEKMASDPGDRICFCVGEEVGSRDS